MRALLTTFVIAPAHLLWDRIREHFGGVRRRGGVLTDDEGLARLEVPYGWVSTAALHAEASLQVCDHLRRRFLILFSEARQDYEPRMTLERHSLSTRSQLMASLQVFDVRGPEYRHVGGHPAIQYEIEGAYNMGIFRYLHTTVQGERAFHQVLCWSKKSRFERPIFERLLDGFSELPGPPPSDETAAPPSAVMVEPTSAYEVH